MEAIVIAGIVLIILLIIMWVINVWNTPPAYLSYNPNEELVYVSTQHAETVYRECGECNGTGQCRLCRGTGGSGWSGSRVMLPNNRCPQCLGSGVCHTCRATSVPTQW